MSPGPLVRESFAAARSQPAASLVTVLIVAAMMLATLLTSGRTVGAEQQIERLIDAAGTRAIIVRAEDEAGLTSDALKRLDILEGIEWAAAFSQATDSTNTLLPGGQRVAVRTAYGDDLLSLGVPPQEPTAEHLAYASPAALEALGFRQPGGSITLTGGATTSLGGALRVPDYLSDLEPLILIPGEGQENPIHLLIVIASEPELIAPISEAMIPLLAPDDITRMTVETSEKFADLRGEVGGELSIFSRALLLALLGVMTVLVFILLFGLTTMRRKDFGRRRALGATKGLVVALLLLQTAILALAGVLLGIVAGIAALAAADDPLPSLEFTVSLAVLGLAAALAAAAVPAVLASRREPARELRVA